MPRLRSSSMTLAKAPSVVVDEAQEFLDTTLLYRLVICEELTPAVPAAFWKEEEMEYPGLRARSME